MHLTQAQQRAIDHRGGNLLVSASAGSGKTEVLARRCASLIADPQSPCDVNRLLVVTFTRAAATELRVRVGRMLRETAAQADGERRRAQLRRQEVLLATADISTIDAWCGRILREHFAEAGLDAGFGVLAAEDAAVLRAEALDALFTSVVRGVGPLAAEVQAWLARAPAPGDEFLRGLVRRLNRFREHLVNPGPWFVAQQAAAERDDTVPVLAAALAEECCFQAAQLASLRPPGGEVADAFAAYAAQLRTWAESLDDSPRLQVVATEIGACQVGGPRPRGARPDPLLTEVRETWLKRLKKLWSWDVLAPLVAQGAESSARVATLLRLEAEYEADLQARKRLLARYEFADVLRLTLDLLGTPDESGRRVPTAVAERLRRRYRHVLVDEYQDTSPVQVELLRLVARDGRDPGNRFLVGDVKQSIYGFRQAAPRLFTELCDAYDRDPSAGQVDFLADNFRSHAGLLVPLNAIFATLFERALGGTDFGPREQLQAARAADEPPNSTLDAAPRVAVHVITAGADDTGDDATPDEALLERIEREAHLAAAEIHRLRAAGTQVAQRDANGCAWLRPLRLADVVILLRSAHQNAGRVARVLRDQGLPCATAGREQLLDTPEAHDLRSVLQLLVNRRQDVPLAAYLRGPLAGGPDDPAGSLSAAELLAIRQACPQPHADFYAAVEHYRAARPDAQTAARLDAALVRLDRWYATAIEADLTALLAQIDADSAWLLFVTALPGGAQRVAVLRTFQQLAEQFSARGLGGVAEFVAYLDALADEDITPGSLDAGDEDVVRIMTIHGAKGLEFPVVLLLGAGARFNTASQCDPLQADETLGVGVRVDDYPLRTALTSARHHVIARRVANRALEEELRLLYVAATRARERLVIVGHARADAWEQHLARYAAGDRPPLLSRLSVASRLEWVLMAVATSGLHSAAGTVPPPIELHVQAVTDVVTRPAATAPPPAAPPAPVPDDGPWISAAADLLRAQPDRTLADFPAVVSVSTLKEAARPDRDADQPAVLALPLESLSQPAFAADAPPDGRTVGSAVHRFMERANLTQLADRDALRTQVASLVASRWLLEREAALLPLEDLLWLAGSTVGGVLAAHAAVVQRELPFVYALPVGPPGEHTLVRGVIDVLVPTADGLVLLDYKTDLPRDDIDYRQRIAGYSVQLQLYARAAAQLFGQSVARATLVFLRRRTIVDVPLIEPDFAALLARVYPLTGDAARAPS